MPLFAGFEMRKQRWMPGTSSTRQLPLGWLNEVEVRRQMGTLASSASAWVLPRKRSRNLWQSGFSLRSKRCALELCSRRLVPERKEVTKHYVTGNLGAWFRLRGNCNTH